MKVKLFLYLKGPIVQNGSSNRLEKPLKIKGCKKPGDFTAEPVEKKARDDKKWYYV
jgi:hypothetical protein